MEINEFTKRFQQFERDSGVFEYVDGEGIPVWDSLRYAVFNHVYQTILSEEEFASAMPFPQVNGLLKRIAQFFLSKITQSLVLLCSKYRRNKVLFLTCSRAKNKESLYIDPLISQLNCNANIYPLVIETSFFKTQLFHCRFLFSYKEKVQHNVDSLVIKLNESINSTFFLELDLSSVIYQGLSDFYTEFKFYDRLFKHSQINKVFMVQNGIQKGLMVAARLNGVVVNELQHGYVGFSHPAYSYPEKVCNKNIFTPNRLLTYSNFWHLGYSMPRTEKVVIGSKNHRLSPPANAHREYKKLLIVSRDNHHKELKEIACLVANELTDFDVTYKLHPNQFSEMANIVSYFDKYKNITVVSNEVSLNECLEMFINIACIQTTAIYEALQVGCYVYCLTKLDFIDDKELATKGGYRLISNAEDLITFLNHGEGIKNQNVCEFFSEFDGKVARELAC